MNNNHREPLESVPTWQLVRLVAFVLVVLTLLAAVSVVAAGDVTTGSSAAIVSSDSTAADETEPTEIDSCTSIDSSGTYELSDDIEPDEPEEWESQDACITINSSAVTLDGGGHAVDGEDVSPEGEDVRSTRGIQVVNGSHPGQDRENPDGWLGDVTIENVKLDHWDRSVHAVGASNITVEDVDSRYGYLDPSAQESSIDVNFRHGSNVEIRNVDATEGQEGRTVVIDNVSGADVEDVSADREQFYGDMPIIDVVDSPNVEITGAVINNSEATFSSSPTDELGAIEFENAPESVVTDSEIEGMNDDDWDGYGIRYKSAGSNANAEVADNDLSDVDIGIFVTGADGASVAENTIEGEVGLEVTESDDTTVTENEVTATGGTDPAILLSDGNDPVVTGNSIEEAFNGLELYNVAPEEVADNELDVERTAIQVESDGDSEVGASEFEIADLDVVGDIAVVSRPNVTVSGATVEDGRIELDTNSVGGPDPDNVHLENIEISGFEGTSGSLSVMDATGLTVDNVTSVDGTETAFELEDSSDVSIEEFAVNGHDGDDSFAFVQLEETEDIAIDGLNVSDNPASVTDGFNPHEGVLSVIDSESIEVSDLTALDNDLEVPTLSVGSDSDVTFDDVVVSANNYGAVEASWDAGDVVGENVTMGTETTVSFDADAVTLGDVQPAPDETDATPIDQYVSIELKSEDAESLDLETHYDDEDVAGVDESTLELRQEDGDGTWTPVDDSNVDTEEQTIAATVTELPDEVGDTVTVGAFGEGDELADRTVAADGSADYETIQDAVNESSPGDTIAVEDGTYEEEVTVDVADLELIAATGDTPVLDGSDALESGFEIEAEGVTIDGFEITGYAPSATSGAIIADAQHVSLKNNTVTENENGVDVGSDNVLLEHNTITDNTINGIDIGSSDNVEIRNNKISGHQGQAVAETGAAGIRVAHDATIVGNSIANNEGSEGSSVDQAIEVGNDAYVADNELLDNRGGIDVGLSGTIQNNTISGGADGEAVDVGGDATIRNNTITDGERRAITVDGANPVIENNIIRDHGPRGIGFWSTEEGATIHNNTLSGHEIDIDLEGWRDVTVTENEFETGLVLESSALLGDNPHTMKDNTVDGDPLYYASSETNPDIDESAAQVILINVEDAEVSGLETSNVASSVQVAHSENVVVTGNELLENDPRPNGTALNDVAASVSVWDSEEFTISNNLIEDINNDRHGIRVRHSEEGTIADNELSGVGQQGGNVEEGIHLYGTDNSTVVSNTVTDMKRGIATENGKENDILENTIEDSERGILADTTGTVDDNTVSGVHGDELTGIVIDAPTAVTNNTVSGGAGNGIVVDGIEDVDVSGNTVTDNDGYGVRVIVSPSSDGTTHTDVRENEIESNQDGGLQLQPTALDDLANLTVANNTFADNTGPGIASPGVDSNAAGIESSVLINYNEFTGNDLGIAHGSADTLNATYNWWGDDSGPSGGETDPKTGETASGSGDEIDGTNVRFDPWLESEPDDDDADPELTVTDLTIDTQQEGETFDVDVTVEEGADVKTENLVVDLLVEAPDGSVEYDERIDTDELSDDSATVTFGGDDGTPEIGPLDANDDYVATATVDADNAEYAEDQTTFDVSGDEDPHFEVSILDTNSPVTEEETFEVDIEVENSGNVADEQTVELFVETEDDAVDSVAVDLKADETHTKTLEFTVPDGFETGDYDIIVQVPDSGTSNEKVDGLTVEETDPDDGDDETTPRPSPSPSPDPEPEDPEPTVSVDTIDNETVATVTDAVANESVSIPVSNDTEEGATTLTSLNVTPSVDTDFEATISSTGDHPAEVEEIPNAAEGLQYAEINTTLESDEIENATLEFEVSSEELDARGVDLDDVTLYHYDDGEWVERETSTQFPDDTLEEPETAEDPFLTVRGETPYFSTFALVGEQPALEIVEHSISATEVTPGEELTVETTVENTGGAAGEDGIALQVNGEIVETTPVTVKPGAEADVAFTLSLEETGEYDVRLDDVEAGTVMVEPEADDEDDEDTVDEDADDDATDDTVDEDADDATDDTADDADDGIPGFGIVAALIAVVVAVTLSRRVHP